MAVTKTPRNVRSALKLATCTLLSSTTVVTQADENKRDWLFDGAVLYYGEKDRVQVLEPVISLKKFKDFDDFIDYKLTVDVMTGSSPNGATPSNVPQTFTGSSGTSGYSAAANDTPMRDFNDARAALNINTQKPLSNVLRRSTGYALSVEQDYGSLGYNTSLSKDLNDKHTTLTGGAGLSLDLVSPDGGAPDPLTNINDPNNQTNGGDEEEDEEHEGGGEFNPEFKGTFDFMLGVTQVLNRYSLMQLNYSHGFIRGYLTDPYKLVSVVNSATGEPATTSIDPSLTSTTPDGIYLTEKRPDSRDTNSVYWKTVVNIFGSVLRVSYRYFWDDWGIQSDTYDIKYRLGLWDGVYIQPHYRHYTQTSADFYRHSLRSNELIPEYVSADYRLAEFTANTVGLKIGIDFNNTTKFDIRFEKYKQTGNSHPADAVGIQNNYDLYPTLEASIFQISFSKYF